MNGKRIFLLSAMCISLYGMEEVSSSDNASEANVQMKKIFNFMYAVTVETVVTNDYRRKEIDIGQNAFQVAALEYSPHDSAELAAGYENGTVVLWDTEEEGCHTILANNGLLRAMRYNPHVEGELAIGFELGEVVIWDTKKKVKRVIHKGESGPCITALAFNPHDSSELAVGHDNGFFTWDLREGCERQSMIGGFRTGLCDDSESDEEDSEDDKKEKYVRFEGEFFLDYDPHDSRRLAFCSEEGRYIVIWNTKKWKPRKLFKQGGVDCIKYSTKKRKTLGIGTESGSVMKLNTKKNQSRAGFICDGYVTALSLSPHNANEIVAAGSNGKIVLWNGEKEHPFPRGSSARTTSLAHNPHEPYELASGSENGTVIIWRKLPGTQDT